jgi:hypothetical protein
MKTMIGILMMALIVGGPLHAQGGNKVEQAKIAFLTQKLQLTTAEAERFWPVYNEYRSKLREARKGRREEARGMKGVETLSDKEAEEMLTDMLAGEQKMLDLRKEYLAKFKQVMPVKKVVLLLQAEKEFNKELISFIKR